MRFQSSAGDVVGCEPIRVVRALVLLLVSILSRRRRRLRVGQFVQALRDLKVSILSRRRRRLRVDDRIAGHQHPNVSILSRRRRRLRVGTGAMFESRIVFQSSAGDVVGCEAPLRWPADIGRDVSILSRRRRRLRARASRGNTARRRCFNPQPATSSAARSRNAHLFATLWEFQSSAGDVVGCESTSMRRPSTPSGFNPQPATSSAARLGRQAQQPSQLRVSILSRRRRRLRATAGDGVHDPRLVSILSRRRRRLRGYAPSGSRLASRFQSSAGDVVGCELSGI